MKAIVALCLLGMSLLTSACHPGKAAEAVPPTPVTQNPNTIILTNEQLSSSLLQMVTVKKEDLTQTVDVLGTIASDTDQVTQVHPEGTGWVKEALVAVGDNVKAGQTLLRYSTSLRGSDAHDVVAPKSGILLGLYADRGDLVEPAIPIATIADVSQLRCILDVFEKDIGRIAKGQKATIHVSAFPDQTFTGHITYISPRVNEDTRTIKVRVDVSNPQGKLKFGMFVNGSIAVNQHEGVAVPQTAVQDIDGKTSVLALQGPNTVVIKPIVLGEKIDGKVEIKSGLNEGETVIGQGSFILKNEFHKTATPDE